MKKDWPDYDDCKRISMSLMRAVWTKYDQLDKPAVEALWYLPDLRAGMIADIKGIWATQTGMPQERFPLADWMIHCAYVKARKLPADRKPLEIKEFLGK